MLAKSPAAKYFCEHIKSNPEDSTNRELGTWKWELEQIGVMSLSLSLKVVRRPDLILLILGPQA